MLNDYISMDEALSVISLLKYLYDHGKGEFIENRSKMEFSYEDCIAELYWEAMNAAAEHVHNTYVEEYAADRWYFSDPVMVEYYRLTQELCAFKGLGFDGSSYDKAARDFIRYADTNPGFAFDLVLKTKTRRRKPCHILIYVYQDFDDPFDLAEYINSVFDFYREKLPGLQEEYARLTTPAELEAAA